MPKTAAADHPLPDLSGVGMGPNHGAWYEKVRKKMGKCGPKTLYCKAVVLEPIERFELSAC